MRALLVSLLVFTILLLTGTNGTPLDAYVNAPDSNFHWKLNSTIEGYLGYTAYVLQLTSQTWMTTKQSNTPIWKHWLTICVPDAVYTTPNVHTAFMYIDGGHDKDPAPTSVFELVEIDCLKVGTVSAHLQQIPNQPITFENEKKGRSEDSLIAYTWSHFLNDTSDPTWLARLPMTKAGVKAMDAISEFISTLDGVPAVNDFVVAGASKRGWTTWCLGAVDKRVVAMVPMVMPILNIVPNMNHHYQAYGGWSFALDDYLKMGIMGYLNDPVFLKLADIVDPWVYRDRLTMPKLIMTAAGDEFFLPDSPQFFMDGLPGEKLLTVIPDAEHTLATALIEVVDTITTFHHMIVHQIPRPVYTYEIIRSNTTATIRVHTKTPPSAVTLWYANTLSADKRDFRLVVCEQLPECLNPVVWWYESLTETELGSGTYEAKMNAPPIGWTGFLIELTYSYGTWPFAQTLRLSTEVNIVPDVMPFPPCGHHCQ